jgi:hypothetical protein
MIEEMTELTAAEFEALGVYDLGAPHAAQRLELLEYLVALGATAEDLVAYPDELPGLATACSASRSPVSLPAWRRPRRSSVMTPSSRSCG